MLNFTDDQFKELKMAGEAFYKSLGAVYCPYFKENISFGPQGFEHLEFKSRKQARRQKDQYMRFKLLYLVPDVLRASHTLQGLFETRGFERIRIHSRVDNMLLAVTYYEFIAILNRKRVRVIVKQIDSGQKFFWSIIPMWGMNNKTKTRILNDGLLEGD